MGRLSRSVSTRRCWRITTSISDGWNTPTPSSLGLIGHRHCLRFLVIPDTFKILRENHRLVLTEEPGAELVQAIQPL